jgi:crotonobetainyl-CoA:carnitine CoA-transferase CaiB-like acyl-CoA transferase/acetyl esterase/lipase
MDLSITKFEPNGDVRVPAFTLPVSGLLSPEAAAFQKMRAAMPPFDATGGPEADVTVRRAQINDYARAGIERLSAMFAVDIAERTIGGIEVLDVTPAGGGHDPDRVLINLHGGAFTVGWDGIARLESIPIAALGAWRVVSVNYRMAPEHRHPAGVEDVAAVYAALLADYAPGRIGIFGGSAGGALTAQAAAWLPAHGLPQCGAVGIFGAGGVPFGAGESAYVAGYIDASFPPPPADGSAGPDITRGYFADCDPRDPTCPDPDRHARDGPQSRDLHQFAVAEGRGPFDPDRRRGHGPLLPLPGLAAGRARCLRCDHRLLPREPGLTMSERDATPWPGPLAGIRVLDFTRVLAGPAASLALADLGAEVIKVEPPGSGDETRDFPPIRGGESHYFLSVNRGKKSIVIDLKSEAGVALAKDLAAKCDVVVENYRPGVMDRLGLGYAALSAINPRLIYCAISGYGQTGPLKDNPSFDIVLQAMSGALSVNGEPGQQPTKLGIPLGDLVGGINGPIAILGALHERHATGRGRYIDISLMDGLLGMLGYIAQLAFFTGEDPQPQGSQHPNLVPYGAFPAADGSIIVACLTNSFWGRICTALGCPEKTGDPRYDTIQKRRDARAEVNAIVSGFTAGRTVAELVELFTKHQVPHAPILGVTEALSQPQTVAREMVVETEHRTLGKIPIVNRPIRFDERQPVPAAPPVLGQDTDAILGEVLGLTPEHIADLRATGAIA